MIFKKKIIKIIFLVVFLIKNYSINISEGLNLYKKSLNHEKFINIIIDIYKKYPSFFYENPNQFFLLNENNFLDFYINMQPLLNFFQPLKLDSICFPCNLENVSDNFKNILSTKFLELKDLSYTDIVVLKGNTYEIMEKELFEILNLCKQTNKKIPIYIIVNPKKLYSNITQESIDNITLSLEKKLNRALTGKEKKFIINHLSNEFDVGLIFDYFFNTEKNIILFSIDNEYYYEDFFNFLKKKNIDNKKILFLNNELLATYEELKYNIFINTIQLKYNFEVIFKSCFLPFSNVNLDNQKKTYQIIKIITVILNEILNHINEENLL